MPEERDTRETRLSAELTLEVYRALNFDPAEFAQRHGAEFTSGRMECSAMWARKLFSIWRDG